MHTSKVLDNPAIVIAAFGSSRRGKAALQIFHEKVRDTYPDHAIYWAYTSKIIRKKTGNPGLRQTLRDVSAAGFAQVAVLPLQVFPGSEYCDIHAKVMNVSDIQREVGETLLHAPEYLEEIMGVLSQDFLACSEGMNLLALHGTTSKNDMVTKVYQHLEKYIGEMYTNVFAASLEGKPDYSQVFSHVEEQFPATKHSRIRLLPLMYIAGLHVEDDLMGQENSWKSRLESKGYGVECLHTEYRGERYYKSLAAYHGIHEIFLQRLTSCLEKLR